MVGVNTDSRFAYKEVIQGKLKEEKVETLSKIIAWESKKETFSFRMEKGETKKATAEKKSTAKRHFKRCCVLYCPCEHKRKNSDKDLPYCFLLRVSSKAKKTPKTGAEKAPN